MFLSKKGGNKISKNINQFEKIVVDNSKTFNKTLKPKQLRIFNSPKKRLLWKILMFFIVIFSLVGIMITLIIKSNSNNTYINNNDSNWNDDTNTWNSYYKNKCPINKSYDLSKYQDNLNNITLLSTVKNAKHSFTINDLLSEIDSNLVNAHVDIPNNFFSHLPLNPAISIKINNDNALLSAFVIILPKYKEQSKMNIEIVTSDVGPSYHLQPSKLQFKFIVKNELTPTLIDISHLALDAINKVVSMIDITCGSKQEVIAGIENLINNVFIKKINDVYPWRPITNKDFTINYDDIKDVNNYQAFVNIFIIIKAVADNDVINGTLNLKVGVKGVNTTKSLNSFKATLEANELLTNETLIVDNAHLMITKSQIEEKISSILTKLISAYGLKTWEQTFSDDDYIITTNATDADYYYAKNINVNITGKNQLKDTINIDIKFSTFFSIKTLSNFEQYLNKYTLTHPDLQVNDDKNVQKDEIDESLITLFGSQIESYGLKTWEQTFSDDDYVITTDFKGGNCQSKVTNVNLCITGKNQLKDTINIKVVMKCQNQKSNEQIFNNPMDVSVINPIALKANDGETEKHYIIKTTGPSVVEILLSDAKNDLNEFPHLDPPGVNINLALHAQFVMDDDNYQLDFEGYIDPIIIKNALKFELSTNCTKIKDYQHLTSMSILIVYNDENGKEKELKMFKEIFMNISADCQLRFTSLSTAITIKSFR